jgi:hypothetical protein
LLRFGDPDWTQTSDLLLRRQLLYSAELPDLTVLNGGKDKGNREKVWKEILIDSRFTLSETVISLVFTVRSLRL